MIRQAFGSVSAGSPSALQKTAELSGNWQPDWLENPPMVQLLINEMWHSS